jgi:hypothetical protein
LRGDGNTVGPVKTFVVNAQLAGRPRVVEHGHLALADDDEPLLLVGVKPTHEDVRAHAVREPEVGDGRVSDARLEIAAPDGGDRLRSLPTRL